VPRNPIADSIEVGIVILVVVLGIIYFIVNWISAHWSTILLLIEIVIAIIIVAAILYAIYYYKNYDEIQREKQRQKEIDQRAREIRREIQNSGIDYHEQKRFPITKYPVRSRHIPTHVKNEVWERDGGKCVLCGSRRDLEWDHDIPFSRSGSNTSNNIRILCKECNRKKSGKIE
jgi:uncharacterized membrane protein